MEQSYFSLQNKSILVLGASSGIGKSIAVECAKAGASLILIGRNSIKLHSVLEELSTEYGQNHVVEHFDISDMDAQNSSVKKMKRLNGVVSCIGILKKQPFKFLKEADIKHTINTNFTDPVIYIQKLFRNNLLSENSSIVFISSIAAEIASFGNLSYMASKGALNSMAKGMALELSSKGIRVNCIEPALVQTELTSILSDDDLNNYLKRFPLGRFGLPEEIAYASIYLLSDAAKWITGIRLRLDGGVTLR